MRGLLVAQVAVSAATGSFLALAVVTATEVSGRGSSAGLLIALWNISAGGGALLTGRLMDRVGHRLALASGNLLIAVGGLAAAAAVTARSPLILLAASSLVGAGIGGALLTRAPVADLHGAATRARALGMLVAAGAIGAVASPFIVDQLAGLSHRLGIQQQLLLPWLLVPALATLGTTAVLTLPPPTRRPRRSRNAQLGGDTGRSLRRLLHLAPIRAAFAASTVTLAAIVAATSSVTVAASEHGTSTVALLMSIHLAGGRALAPAIGTLLDRHGRRHGFLGGASFAALGAALSTHAAALPVAATGLFLLGLGWSATYLATTALVTDLTRRNERARLLGLGDLLASAAAAAGASGGGLIFESAGLPAITLTTAALVLMAPIPVLRLSGTSKDHTANVQEPALISPATANPSR